MGSVLDPVLALLGPVLDPVLVLAGPILDTVWYITSLGGGCKAVNPIDGRT